MVSNFHPISSLGLALVAASLLLSCGGRDPDGTWEMPNGDLASTRAATEEQARRHERQPERGDGVEIGNHW